MPASASMLSASCLRYCHHSPRKIKQKPLVTAHLITLVRESLVAEAEAIMLDYSVNCVVLELKPILALVPHSIHRTQPGKLVDHLTPFSTLFTWTPRQLTHHIRVLYASTPSYGDMTP